MRNALIVATGLITGTAFAESVNFDGAKVGEAPAGWTATKTGKGNAKWTIEKDDTAPSKPNVLKQSGEVTYPVCIKDDTSVKDGFVEVKFKPVAGKEDQAGGVIWRCKDADNYYIARANALEDNVTIYHTIGGRRVSFKNVDTKVAPGTWHTLRVEFSGNKFTVIFDGKQVIGGSCEVNHLDLLARTQNISSRNSRPCGGGQIGGVLKTVLLAGEGAEPDYRKLIGQLDGRNLQVGGDLGVVVYSAGNRNQIGEMRDVTGLGSPTYGCAVASQSEIVFCPARYADDTRTDPLRSRESDPASA
jgi:hypothetical protein